MVAGPLGELQTLFTACLTICCAGNRGAIMNLSVQGMLLFLSADPSAPLTAGILRHARRLL
jgi:hypothetical protein